MGGVVVALTSQLLQTAWFQTSPRSIISAEGLARWALGQQVGLRQHSFGSARALAFEKPLSLPSTLHNHGSALILQQAFCSHPRLH